MSMVRVIAVALCIAAVTFGCSREPAETERPVIVVSVPPQADIVERLAGDLVDVVVMVPPGANPTTYEPTMSQMRAVSEMALYVKVGHPHFPFEETWFDRMLEEAESGGYVDCAHGLPLRDDDPHIWLAPSCMRMMAGRIAAVLLLLMPDHEKTILANQTPRGQGDVRGRADRRWICLHPARPGQFLL